MEYLFLNDLCIGGIHIEPIRELLNLTYDINKQSYSYAEKRGYCIKREAFISLIAEAIDTPLITIGKTIGISSDKLEL